MHIFTSENGNLGVCFYPFLRCLEDVFLRSGQLSVVVVVVVVVVQGGYTDSVVMMMMGGVILVVEGKRRKGKEEEEEEGRDTPFFVHWVAKREA